MKETLTEIANTGEKTMEFLRETFEDDPLKYKIFDTLEDCFDKPGDVLNNKTLNKFTSKIDKVGKAYTIIKESRKMRKIFSPSTQLEYYEGLQSMLNMGSSIIPIPVVSDMFEFYSESVGVALKFINRMKDPQNNNHSKVNELVYKHLFGRNDADKPTYDQICARTRLTFAHDPPYGVDWALDILDSDSKHN